MGCGLAVGGWVCMRLSDDRDARISAVGLGKREKRAVFIVHASQPIPHPAGGRHGKGKEQYLE